MRSHRWAALLAAALIPALEASAYACGGTFCDTGPTAMPVDQSGENILFVVKDTTVEAHVQIEYEGSAERFAWVVPMPAEPTVTVGSEPLFDALLASTVPRVGFTTQRDSCPCSGCGGAGGATGFPPSFTADAAASADAGVRVLFQQTVGTFEVTALTGSSAAEVTDWLSQNGYESIDTAPAILQRYVDRGMVFVALKLTAGAEADSIHPLVFEYVGDEPCIPLELTAVAAVEDMGVRAFFLGDDRVVPTSYSHVTLNPARIDWPSLGTNYEAVVSRAVDEAGGLAFITEYAGASSIVSGSFESSSWSAGALAGLSPAATLRELARQNLGSCFEWGTGQWTCEWYHPLILPLLRAHLPAPPDIDESAYYGCLACAHSGCEAECTSLLTDAGARTSTGSMDAGPDGTADGGAAPAPFDSVAFSNDVDERIIQPARRADRLLARYPYLTRLFTTISPSEMTADPFFAPRADLAEVPLLGTAVRRIVGSQMAMILPDGREVAYDGSWPAFTSAMPWAERIEEFSAGTDRRVVRDSGEQIDAELERHNAARGWPAELDCPSGFGASGGTGFGGAAGDGSGGTGGIRTISMAGNSGLPQATDGGTADKAADDDGSGAASSCSCRLGSANLPANGAWTLVGLGLLVRRRHRKERGAATPAPPPARSPETERRAGAGSGRMDTAG